MSTKTDTLHFEVSANLQRLIGRELVPNDEMAVVELVKNAYDSGASRVEIFLDPGSDTHPGHIEFRDDGAGMSLDEFRDHFMFVGYSSRPDELASAKRVPTGEKGIGRFAADKLGKELTVYTKKRSKELGLRLRINWRDFEDKTKLFSDVGARYETVAITGFEKGSSGTRLRIDRLRSAWPRNRIEQLRQWLAELFDPFHRPSNFQIYFTVENSPKLSGPVRQSAPEGADIEIDFEIAKTGRTLRRLRMHGEGVIEEAKLETQTELEKLRGLKGRFLYAEKRIPKAKSKGLVPGVRLYRDGFRIEPFGSPTADWLGVFEKRAKRAGHAHIVPSRLYGFIEILRKDHATIADTTSRQALLDSEEATRLVAFLREQLAYLEGVIRTKIAEPRWQENRRKRAVEFEQAKLQTLGVLSFGLAHELRQPLQSIRSEAHNISTRLRQLGISDPDISGAQKSIDRGVDRINRNIELISEISKENWDEVSRFDLAELIREESALFKTRCSTNSINIQTSVPPKQEARLSKAAISTVLLNLVTNSIDAIESRLDKSNAPGMINVSLSQTSGIHVLAVSDNGGGIPEEIQPKIFRRFASKKTGGMGVGLYYCKTVIEACGGTISFESTPGIGSTFTVRFPDSTGQ